MVLSGRGVYGGSGVAVKVRDSGVIRKQFLSSPSSLEAQPASLLLLCGLVRLLDEVVTASGRDDLDVLHVVERGKCPDGGTVTPQLIGVDDLWDAVLANQPGEEGPGGR
ncbi:hypothetical protein GCM10010841_28040 [Deinococcus aerophilus]|uniref:Uncharacterized protein n=1 Tax=Deinococcus aerophilus TaxID=522488 RepID=A0ABQ2GZ40_9DEIO|nr:hypothetical protein GCM10010841_28040 [Deinococcus aerophilus]